MSGNNVVATLNTVHGVFENIPPDCYRLIICTSNNYYCCKDLPCDFIDPGCCELRYSFFTDIQNPVWNFGDNTTSGQQNPVHEYTNINTYPSEGTPQTTITLPWGSNPIQSVIQFPQGIWVGSDCNDSGPSSALKNSVSPTLFVFPSLSYQNREISIKGSVTMDQNYQFANCDFCMHPSSRIVSSATTLSFLDSTVLHEAACKTWGWYGVDVRSGTLVGTGATFTGAYSALHTTSHTIGAPVFRLTGCQFNRNYLGINLSKGATFATFSGNTFGNAGGVLTWPGLPPAPCAWVALINRPVLPEPFAGIHARAANPQAAFSVNLPAATPNVFVNLANGIYLQDVNARIQRCRFQNMVTVGYDLNGLLDDGVGIALLTANSRSLQQWGLGKNSTALTFENCRRAMFVSLEGAGNVLFQSYNNNILNVGAGYTLFGGGNGTFRANSIIQYNQINQAGIGGGIRLQGVSPDTRLTITRNRIVGGTWGILLDDIAPPPLGGEHTVSIVNNVKETSTDPDGIYDSESSGIEMSPFSNVLVENNTVEDFGNWGIINLNGTENDIRCNEVSSAVATGNNDASIRNSMSPSSSVEYNQTDGSGSGISFLSTCNNTTVRCNTIGSHNTGLHYNSNAVTGPQLPNGTSAGNVWVGTYTDKTARNDNPTPGSSRYFYRTGEINPAQIFPFGNAWFQFVTDGVTCGSGCPQDEFAERSVTELDTEVANDSLSPGGLSGYLLKRFLYNDLLYYPALLQNNATLQNFQSSFGSTNGGKLTSLEKTMADAFHLTAQQQSQRDAAQNSLASAFEQLVILDSLVQYGAAPTGQAAQRDTLEQQISAAQAILQDIYEDNLDARTDSVSALQQMLNSVTPQAQWETNEKTLNEIYLNTAFIDQSPDTSQTAQIRQIGEQCSMDGGPAVVRARAWYYLLTGVRLEVDCGGVIERNADESTVEQIQLIVSPNPAGDKILIQLLSAISQKGQLEIFDVSGKLCQTISIPEKALSIEVSTAELANGIYFCRLISAGRILISAKFSIQH